MEEEKDKLIASLRQKFRHDFQSSLRAEIGGSSPSTLTNKKLLKGCV